MAPRIGHRKSRNGCLSCKARKVKCDEVRPRCGGCSRSQISCVYVSGPLATAGHTRDGKAMLRPKPDMLLVPAVDDMLPAYLLHNFTANVIPSLATDQFLPIGGLFSGEMMDLAFDNSALLDGILSVSALHVGCTIGRREGCQNREQAGNALPSRFRGVDFGHRYGIYLDRAVRGQRQTLASDMTPSNAAALFFASIMLSIACLQLPPSLYQGCYSPLWLTIFNAVSPVRYAAGARLSSKSVVEQLITASKANLVTESYFHPIDPEAWEEFQPLLDFDDSDSAETPDERAACEDALGMVAGILSAMQRGEDAARVCRRLMAFGPKVPPLFVSMLSWKAPRALAVLAQFLALTALADRERFWWLRGFAERELRCLPELMPTQWAWALRWPLGVVLGGGDSEKTDWNRGYIDTT